VSSLVRVSSSIARDHQRAASDLARLDDAVQRARTNRRRTREQSPRPKIVIRAVAQTGVIRALDIIAVAFDWRQFAKRIDRIISQSARQGVLIYSAREEENSVFIKNCWYVAAFGDEVSNRPLARRILGEHLVLFRQSNRTVVALEDRCSHRGLPLSLGELNGDLIRCSYHGLEYDCSGKCVFIPGQKSIPPAARVRSYPVCERGRALWIWMGNPENADESEIPAFPWFDDPGWAWKGKTFPIKCNYQMLNDNLLDLSHLAYVHRGTLGGNPEIHFNAEMETTHTARSVKVVRRMPDCEPPPTYTRMVELNGRVDRWQEIEFFPGLITLYSGGVDAGTGAYEGPRQGGFQLRLFDAVTPESETTTLNLFSF
jgi:phenylpropionate dioxygenase-like ring-hydroxylating dioxygenase large terminal subunit